MSTVESIPKVRNKQLVLIRHAKSAYPPGVADHDRPLTDRGRRDAAAVAHWLASSEVLDRRCQVLVSSATRAQDSWLIMSSAIKTVEVLNEPRLYDASVATILDIIGGAPADIETLIVIAHNPGLEGTASSIALNRDCAAYLDMCAKYPTSGIAVLEVADWAGVTNSPGVLTQFAVPRG